jgi:hypothetical protein
VRIGVIWNFPVIDRHQPPLTLTCLVSQQVASDGEEPASE